MGSVVRRRGRKSARRWYLVATAIVGVVVAGVLLLWAVSPPSPPFPPLPWVTAREIPRIEVEQAREQLRGGGAIIVDVRSAEAYAQSHISGAISIPFAEVEKRSAELPKDKNIITY